MTQILLLSLSAIALALTSCNTVAGMGRDMQQAGDAVQNAAHQSANR